MHAFDILGDPVRRHIIELLATGEQTAGAITASVVAEFGISQPAVSRHLRVLREGGVVDQRADGTRRHYALAGDGLAEAKAWIARVEGFWSRALDALGTEITRQNRRTAPSTRRRSAS